jgi:sugar phosphate isomerase/epimerase
MIQAMKRCFSTLGCAELGLDEVIALAWRHKIDVIELRALGGTLDLPGYFSDEFCTPDKLAKHILTAGVPVTALDTSLMLNGSTDLEWMETIEAFLPWAEAMGGVDLRVFDGSKTNDETSTTIMADRVDWWQQLRARSGWQSDIMIEIHDSLFTAAANLALIAKAPAARILWDSHHTWKRGGEDPVTTWRAIATHVVHIHVKDSISMPSARHPFTYVLPGEGEFPTGPIMELLGKEYAGVVSLEWEKLWHPYLPPSMSRWLQPTNAPGGEVLDYAAFGRPQIGIGTEGLF